MRCRTNTIGAVTRVRNNLAYATHQFFQTRGFLYIHTPIITASDCEGAGEMFQVTTILPEKDKPISAAETTKRVKTTRKTDEEIKALEIAKKKAEGKKAKLTEEDIYNYEDVPLEQQKFNYKNDMFGKPANLSVSGQLNVECFTVGLSDTYTFGPTFSAENSHTSRHLCEFWMIEPELAFATIQDDMDCAEDYVKFCIKYVLKNNKDDLDFFNKLIEKGIIDRLNAVANSNFKRLPYTEAIEILEKEIQRKDKGAPKFEEKVYWGCDLASEHEKWLTD